VPRTERWHLTYDDGNQEDEYDERPSEFMIRLTRRAAPDAGTALYHSPNGWERHLVQRWEPLDARA
jgi:hypothetical protein